MAAPSYSPTIMATGTPLPAFEHDPLPDSTTHFRLLHITRGDFEQHVECEISTWPIDGAPPYYAISYTWGDPADTTELTVNGKPLVVRRNCEYVLQQAFASKASRYFWVDAICIAQNTEEKNYQVGIMGEIYSRAKHVFACVGPHENDSELLSVIITNYRPLLRNIGARIKQVEFDMWNNPIKRSKRLHIHCLLSTEALMRQRLYDAFISFMHRQYFTRVWVMQELHLAQSVSYYCGTSLHAAEDLLAVHFLLDIWGDFLKPRDSIYQMLVARLVSTVGSIVVHSRTKVAKKTIADFISIYHASEYLGLSCINKRKSLTYLLLYAESECSDPRDRLFGVLSLVDWPGGKKPAVDYKKDRFEVAENALRLLAEEVRYTTHYATTLCQAFQLTGNEASLRRALAARSCASQTGAIRNPVDYTVSQMLFDWEGFRLRICTRSPKSLELSFASHWRAYLRMQEHDGGCVVEMRKGSELVVLQAPLEVKSGDWYLCCSSSFLMHRDIGLVVRNTGKGRNTVVGQTHILEANCSPIYNVRRQKGDLFRFAGYWNAEDALILAWTRKQLLSEDITQDQIHELVNRRVCAWDGSSFFRKSDDPEPEEE